MQKVIRLSPTVTLRLTPCATASPATPKKLCATLKLKPSRQALTSITNLSIPHAVETDDAPTVVTSSSSISPPLTSCDVRIPGPFTYVRHVQRGSFSTAVAVRDTNGGREVRGRVLCMKIFVKEEAIERRARHVIVQELLAYQAISIVTGQKWLPFVMRLDASLEDAYCLYFAMDLMNCDLLDVLTHWSFSDRAIYKKEWAAQIATGIAAIHGAGILHRDIKPENILIDFRQNVRLSDFGCVFVSPDNKALHRYGEYCTDVCGTWPYQAPEMLGNEGKALVHRRQYGMAVDYWALGCIIFELEVEETRTLFDTTADLKAYQKYRPSFNRGKSYLDAFALSADAEDLILGLVRVSPTFRFGREIRRHAYFKDAIGASEFDGIEDRGEILNELSLSDEVPKDRVKRDLDEFEVYCPAVYPADEPPDEHSFDNHCWINPGGIWGNRL